MFRNDSQPGFVRTFGRNFSLFLTDFRSCFLFLFPIRVFLICENCFRLWSVGRKLTALLYSCYAEWKSYIYMFESGISISVSRDLRPPVAYPIALAMKFSPSEKTSYRKTGNIGNSKADTAKGRNLLGADSVVPLPRFPKIPYYIALERQALADRKPRPASPPLTDRHIPERTCYGFRNDSRARTTKSEDTRSYHAAREKRGEKLFIRIGKNAIRPFG